MNYNCTVIYENTFHFFFSVLFKFFNYTPQGSDAGSWYIDLKNDKGGCGKGEAPGGAPDCTMTCNSDKFVEMFSGKLKPTAAFMSGQLKIKGNMALALKLEKLMSEMKSKL